MGIQPVTVDARATSGLVKRPETEREAVSQEDHSSDRTLTDGPCPLLVMSTCELERLLVLELGWEARSGQEHAMLDGTEHSLSIETVSRMIVLILLM